MVKRAARHRGAPRWSDGFRWQGRIAQLRNGMAIEMHTAYEAYLDSSVASMIPARLVPAQADGAGGVGPLFEGSRW